MNTSISSVAFYTSKYGNIQQTTKTMDGQTDKVSYRDGRDILDKFDHLYISKRI